LPACRRPGRPRHHRDVQKAHRFDDLDRDEEFNELGYLAANPAAASSIVDFTIGLQLGVGRAGKNAKGWLDAANDKGRCGLEQHHVWNTLMEVFRAADAMKSEGLRDRTLCVGRPSNHWAE
jgi:hypothetical protein